MADYGLDPSVVNYVQGMPPPQMAPPMPDTSSYGLDPSVIAGLQNGFAPQPQQTLMENPNQPAPVTVGNTASAPPQPVAAPPPQAPPQGSRPGGLSSPGVLANANNSAGSVLPLLHIGAGQGTGLGGDEIAGSAPDDVPSVTGGQLQTQQPQGVAPAPGALPVANSPDQVIGSVAPLTDKQVAATNKVYAAQQAQAAAFANSPEGIQQKADAQNLAAIDKQRQANADADAAQSVQNAATAKATQDLADRQTAQEKIDAAQRAKDQATTAQYSQQYAQQIKDAADYKVNTDRSIGVGGLIAVALSGIGDALDHRHGPNAALQIINDGIDKRIADQWAQKKALGDTAAGTKDLLGESRQNAISDRQDQDVAKAAALTDAKNQIANITAQSANPLLKARGEQMGAALDQQVANLTTGLATRKLEAQKVATDQANKVAERGIQWAGIKQNDVHFNKTLDEQKREHDLQRQDKLDDLEKQYTKALADKAKELKTSGIFDPNTSAPLIDASNPAAQPALLQAKQLDMKAAAATDPAQQAALTKQAADLRNNVNVQFGATLDGKDRDKIIGAQRLINTTQRIRDALEDGSITDRDTRAALKTEADNAFTAWAATNEVKASSREYEVYKEAVGQLDGMSATNVNKGPLEASLKALDTGTQNLVGTTLRGHGIKAIDANGNPWVMTAEKPPQATQLSGTTSVEAGANAAPGAVTRTLGVDLRHPFTSPEARDQLNVENNADVGLTGLSKPDDSKVLGLIKTYGRVSPDENQRVIAELKNLVESPGDDERKQAIANSVISRVKGESPQLYQKVLDALPAGRRKELSQFDLPPVVLNHVMGKK